MQHQMGRLKRDALKLSKCYGRDGAIKKSVEFLNSFACIAQKPSLGADDHYEALRITMRWYHIWKYLRGD